MIGAYYEIILMPRCVYSEHERLHSTMNQWVHPVSCHQFFLEKERVSRTKRAMHWHRVLYRRSMCAVSFVDTAVSLLREHRHVGLPEVAEAVALAVSTRSQAPAPSQTKATTWRGRGISLFRASACPCAATRTTRPRQARSHQRIHTLF